MQKVFVAGATGYLGKFVTRELKKRGHWVRALARNPKKLSQRGKFLEPAVDQFIDDVFTGEVTKPETLSGVCEGIDVVFSSVGITRQKDGLSFKDVDYQGNKNILNEALKSGVKKIIFVSVFGGEQLRHLAIAEARESFVDELKASGIDYTIMRPTGYFSDMSEILQMALKGRVYAIGKSENRMNPIHGADLASACADAIDTSETEFPLGGPEAYNQQELAEIAFRAAGKPVKVTTVPLGLMKAAIGIIRIFSKHNADLFDFFVTASQSEADAPKYGTHLLEDYYNEIAEEWARGSG